jgi:elongation factor G
MTNNHHAIDDIRNVALVGHPGCGKTTLVEALLHRAGAIAAMGNVEKGNTVCDADPEERESHHSFSPAVVGFDHQGHRINVIDTPGLPDFAGQTLSVLPAVETVAVVVNGMFGIELITRRAMDWAHQQHFCRMIIVNKIDAASDLGPLMDRLQEAFGKECLPLNLPSKDGKSVVDCFFRAATEAPAFASTGAMHTALVDQVVELDEDLMNRYLEQGDIPADQLHDPFERALREGHLLPVAFVSARTGAGLGELLDVLVRLAPSPREGNPHPFHNLTPEHVDPIRVEPDPKMHLVAHVFKITHDPFLGRIGMFRVHQGTIARDTPLFVGDGKRPLKAGHIYRPMGGQYIETDRGIPGDICALSKLDGVHLNAILHNAHDEDYVRLESTRLPSSMVGLAVEPKTRGDEQKLADALDKLTAEDPCLVIERNSDSHETVLRGLGEVHLRVALTRIRDRYHVAVNTRPPSVSYRETATRAAEGHHRHKKQTGGAGQFGEVYLRVEPLERGAGFEFVDRIVGAAIPGQFVPAVEKGVRQALAAGAVAGYPIQDVRVTVHGGKHHPVDSQEISFIIAGRKAFLDAMKNAAPILLEPIVNIEIVTPSGHVGDVVGDLSSRRGRISDTRSASSRTTNVAGLVPMAELSDYAARLTSMTAGEGSYTIEFSHYEAAPHHVQQKLAQQFRPTEEA